MSSTICAELLRNFSSKRCKLPKVLYLCTDEDIYYMTAGRPYNSQTPLWRSKPAIRVCLFRLLCFLEKRELSKSACARELGVSRTTVIKWWNLVDWEGGDFDHFRRVFDYQALRLTDYTLDTGQSTYNPDYTMEEIASDCGIPIEKARLLDAIRKEYVAQHYKNYKMYDLDRVKAVGYFDKYWEDAVYLSVAAKTAWKWKKRRKR